MATSMAPTDDRHRFLSLAHHLFEYMARSRTDLKDFVNSCLVFTSPTKFQIDTPYISFPWTNGTPMLADGALLA